MPEPKKLSIIIVAYKSKKYLEACVASLYEKLINIPSWEIIIVNNDESEDIYNLALDFSKIKLIDHKKNIGFGAGANLGVREANGEILLFLNPDAEVLTKNACQILDKFSVDDKIGIIGGKILNDEEKNQKWSAGREISFYDLVRNNLGISRSGKIWKSSRIVNCDWVAGTTMFVRKKMFEDLGGFDDNFFMYFEDMDLCKRIREAGKEVIYFSDFIVRHKNGKSYADKKLQKKHYNDSMEYYFKKNRPKWEYATIKIIRIIFF